MTQKNEFNREADKRSEQEIDDMDALSSEGPPIHVDRPPLPASKPNLTFLRGDGCELTGEHAPNGVAGDRKLNFTSSVPRNETEKSKTKAFGNFQQEGEQIKLRDVVIGGLRAMQDIVGNRVAAYHSLQKYIDAEVHIPNEDNLHRLPYYGTKLPKSVEAYKISCLLSIAAYLIMAWWDYQEGRHERAEHIYKIGTYIKGLQSLNFKKIKVQGDIREGFYLWTDLTKKLNQS